MYSGEGLVPWWVGLEQGNAVVLDGLLTAVDALVPAGLDWEPELKKLYTEHGEVEGWRALVRDDTGSHLGVVTDEYSILHNRSMAETCDLMVDGEARCTTAGVLRSGAVVWFAMKLGEFQVVGDKSPIDLYAVVTTGHDGRHRCKVLITPIRVVCQNTLRAAKLASKWEVSILHHGDTHGRLDTAVQAARQALLFGEKFKALGDLMVTARYGEEFGPILAKVLTATGKEKDWLKEQQVKDERPSWCPDPGLPITEQLLQAATYIPDDLVPPRTREERDTIERLLIGAGAVGVEGTELEGTAWGAFQGVAQWTDHGKLADMSDTKLAKGGDRRAENILWGKGPEIKQTALDIILEQTGLTEQADSVMSFA